MRFPCVVAFPVLCKSHLAALDQLSHSEQLLALVLNVRRIYDPYDLAGSGEPEREAQHFDPFRQPEDPRFRRMQMQR